MSYTVSAEELALIHSYPDVFTRTPYRVISKADGKTLRYADNPKQCHIQADILSGIAQAYSTITIKGMPCMGWVPCH